MFRVLQQATEIATSMVKSWGMSEKVGPRAVGNEVSPAVKEVVDQEIQRILQKAYERTLKILQEHSNELEALAEALMKYETLDADAIELVITEAAARAKMNGTRGRSAG